VGSVVYWRPDGVVHRNVPSGSWSTFRLGCCLRRWSCRHFGNARYLRGWGGLTWLFWLCWGCAGQAGLIC